MLASEEVCIQKLCAFSESLGNAIESKQRLPSSLSKVSNNGYGEKSEVGVSFSCQSRNITFHDSLSSEKLSKDRRATSDEKLGNYNLNLFRQRPTI